MTFPNELPIQVEHISSGSYNRVVCGVLACDQQCPRRVIVCIPRFAYYSPVNEIAVLRFLESTTVIPVPRVLHPHMSSNTISDPFMILEHFQGTCLGDVYEDRPTQMKKSVVRSLVRLLKQLNEVTFDAIGTLISASPVGFGL
jgi:aminoglycoside phosphotransferase (APT) family kinase protein